MENYQEIVRDVADLGPVIARADHRDRVIEVNKRIFYAMPPLAQEFVLCHEVCHLKYNERDEAVTNRRAVDLFLSRSASPDDRAQRERFVAYLDEKGYSNLGPAEIASIVASVIAAVTAIAGTVYSIVSVRNAGWYSWNEATKKQWLENALTNSFEQSRRSRSYSAKDYFMVLMASVNNKDESVEEFLGRNKNAWVQPVIEKYERAYGFGFEEVTPYDLTTSPLAIVAIGALAAFLIYWIFIRKKK